MRNNSAQQIRIKLETFSQRQRELRGLNSNDRTEALVLQIISSLRRVDYIQRFHEREPHPVRLDPRSPLFDPLKAAWLAYNKRGDVDEACWLTFIATHFGKHSIDGWRLARDFYGAFNQRNSWTWTEASSDLGTFYDWLDNQWPVLLGDGVSRRFSNHRKYESKAPKHLKQVLGSYIELIQREGGHRRMMVSIHKEFGQHPKEAFSGLYEKMSGVKRFGRLGRFDFLTMLGKLGVWPIEPDSAYLAQATGPLLGVKLLVSGDRQAAISPAELQQVLDAIDSSLGVGMQVLEDALCNWQKNPDKFVLFRG